MAEPYIAEHAFAAPALPYQPRDPQTYRPGIGLIGCGGISREHLTAYRNADYRVLGLCDVERDRACQRQTEFFPAAQVYATPAEMFAAREIEVIDITTHPAQRPPLVEAALRAKKHVLSQKPFVLDLEVGERLADLADRQGVRLAVNQNGRWAPHFSYLRQAVAAGLVGEVSSVQCSVNWNHNWVQGTPFDKVRHLMLYDFAIHWFDMLTCLMGDRRPEWVFAAKTHSTGQLAEPALLGAALVQYEHARGVLSFDGDARFGHRDSTLVSGSRGMLVSEGPDSKRQQVTLYNADGVGAAQLTGSWFPDGFHGTMGELLTAIEEGREPSHSARNNLQSLALCFAAVASAERQEPVKPGSIRRLEAAWQ